MQRLTRILTRLAAGLAALALMGGLGFAIGAWRASRIDWPTLAIERNLSFLGSVPVSDLAPGTWTQACLFGAYENWGDAPGPHEGVPPWEFDEGGETVLLADAAGRTYLIRLLWMERVPDAANCVPIGKDSRLVAERHEGDRWVLHFE